MIELETDQTETSPRLKRIFSLVDSAVQQRHVIQEKLENWYDDSGHVVLVGDAAHLMNVRSLSLCLFSSSLTSRHTAQ